MKNKKTSLVCYHTSLLTKNVIFNMLSNPSQQRGCQISLDEANSRNESAPRDKTFDALEKSVTWTLKAVPRQCLRIFRLMATYGISIYIGFLR